jgi:hypothetical protein
VAVEWLTFEVVDADVPASGWRSAHGEGLVEAAVTGGAVYWEWHETRWGVVLELAFPDDERLDRYRRLPAVVAALDAVPDPAHGLAVYRGRGGGSGARVPRRPRPRPVAGAAAWPPPDEERYLGMDLGRDDLADGDAEPYPSSGW